mmetsp:Transcript_29397/g.38682  ORF Transcript_29397/g.38682 Transcript_29397/m.38682 type:complete len:91 (-) Transcript_29397:56-328(-)
MLLAPELAHKRFVVGSADSYKRLIGLVLELAVVVGKTEWKLVFRSSSAAVASRHIERMLMLSGPVEQSHMKIAVVVVQNTFLNFRRMTKA